MKKFDVTINKNRVVTLSIEEIIKRLIYLNDKTDFLLVKNDDFRGIREVVTFNLIDDEEESGIQMIGEDFDETFLLSCDEDCRELATVFENLKVYENVTHTQKYNV